MTTMPTNRGMYLIASGDVDMRDDNIKVMLLTSAYTPVATANFVSDVSANEMTGTGYVAGFGGSGRKSLANKTFTEDDSAGTATFDADNLTWTAITAGTFQHAAIIKEVTTDADSLIICFVTFTAQVTAGLNLLVAWHTNGIFRIAASDGSTATVLNVNYTATGSEGTDFTVTIGATMASDVYGVYPANAGAGASGAFLPDCPDLVAGDRTTTTFRVLVADQMPAGHRLDFLIVQ